MLRPVQVDPAEPDALDTLLVEPAEPRVVPRRGSRRPPCRPASLSQSSTYAAGSSTSRCTTSASQPAGTQPPSRSSQGTSRWITQLASTWHQPPRRGGPAPRGRCARRPGRRAARVAVDQSLAGRRRDHERRVGGDQVERLGRDGREERPVADVDRRRAWLRAALNRVIHRPAVDVGGDDVPACAGEVQCLDAAAGAEVEGTADRLAHRQLRQGRRGRADAEHVVGGDPDRGPVEAGGQVADDPQVARRRSAYGRTSSRARTSPPDAPDEARVARAGRPARAGPARRARPGPRPAAGRAGSASRAATRPSYGAGPGWSRCARAPRGRGSRAARRPRRR